MLKSLGLVAFSVLVSVACCTALAGRACEVKLTKATDATRFAAGDYAAICATTTGYVNPVS